MPLFIFEWTLSLTINYFDHFFSCLTCFVNCNLLKWCDWPVKSVSFWIMVTVTLLKRAKTTSQVNYTILSSQGRVKLACHSDVRTEYPFSSMCPVSLSLFFLILNVFFVWLGSPCWNKPVEAVFCFCFFQPLVFNAVMDFPIDNIYSSWTNPPFRSLQVLGVNNACVTVVLDSDVYAGLNDSVRTIILTISFS